MLEIALYAIILFALTICMGFGVGLLVTAAWDIWHENRRTGWQWFSLVSGALIVIMATPLIVHFYFLSLEGFEDNLRRIKGDGVSVSEPESKKADASPPFNLFKS